MYSKNDVSDNPGKCQPALGLNRESMGREECVYGWEPLWNSNGIHEVAAHFADKHCIPTMCKSWA